VSSQLFKEPTPSPHITPGTGRRQAGDPEGEVRLAAWHANDALGQTLRRWRNELPAWHHAKVSNGPTEAANLLTTRIKRIRLGLRKSAHYRPRALLHARQPNWDHLATITPR
jgi:hypothetical protein